MNAVVEIINTAGRVFVAFALPMLIQASLLILILLAVDAVLRRKVRAVFRYWVWMLVLVKLVLPPSLGSPVSIGTWFGATLEAPTAELLEPQEPSPAQPPAPEPVSPAASILSQPRFTLLEPPQPATTKTMLQTPAPADVPEKAGIPAAEMSEAAASVPSPSRALTWQGLALVIWAAVVAALLLLLVQRAFFVRGLIVQADEAGRDLLDVLRECRVRAGVRKPVSLKLSPNAVSPAVCGLIRPVILMPRSLVPRLPERDLCPVLLHELAHVKRGDLWVNLVQTLLQIIYFYNPLLWLANAMIRRTREQAVDEAVLVAMGQTAAQYPETLVNVAKLAFRRRPALSLRLIGVVESRSALTSRIKHILSRPFPKSTKLSAVGVAAILIAAVVLLPMAKAQQRETDSVESRLALLPDCGVWLSDINGQDLPVLDLASERIVTLPNVASDFDLVQTTDRRRGGDILYYYDRAKRLPKITFLEGSGSDDGKPLTRTIIPPALPWEATITARSEDKYEVRIVRADKNGCAIYFRPVKAGTPAAKAILRDGVAVELLGVCEYPSEGRHWWRPDGSPLSQAPYSKRPGTTLRPSNREAPYELAVRLHHLPSDGVAIVGISMPDSRHQGGGNVSSIPDLYSVEATLPRDQESCSVLCLVQTAPWQAMARVSVKALGDQTAAINGVTFSAAGEDPNEGATITASWDSLDRLHRIVAVTIDGRIVDASKTGSSRSGSIGQTTVHFRRLALAEIAEFQFQTQPSLWVEFTNVSLRRGHKSNVRTGIRSIPDPVPLDKGAGGGALVEPAASPNAGAGTPARVIAELPNGMVLELLGVSGYPREGRPWWRPDGDGFLSEAPFPSRDLDIRPSPEQAVYEVAARLQRGPDGLLASIHVPSSGPPAMSSYDRRRVDDNVMYDLCCTTAILPKSQETCSVRCMVQTGPWQTMARVSAKALGSQGAEVGGVRFSAVTEDPEKGPTIKVVHEIPEPFPRIVAVTVDGRIIYPGPSHVYTRFDDVGRLAIREDTMSFRGSTLAEIEEFQFQTQPVAWVEFSNVSLRPGRKTHVQTDIRSTQDPVPLDRGAGGGALVGPGETVPREAVRHNMLQLGLGIALYANEHDGELPATLAPLEPYVGDAQAFAWLKENTVYVAKGNVKDYAKPYSIVTACEAARKALPPIDDRYVLFLDGHVELAGSQRLNEIHLEDRRQSLPQVSPAVVEQGSSERPGDVLKRLLDEVQAGGTVVIPKGRYTEPIEVSKPVVLRGESREECVFEVTADRPGVLIDTKGQGQVTVENVTIKWQLATSGRIERAFALMVKDSNALIRNCWFVPLGNYQRSPVAVQIDGFSKATVDQCRFTGFEYTVCYGPGTEGVVQDCIITDCGHQGVINYDGATLTVQRCVITGSKFHAVRCTGGTLHVKDNLLIKNANRGIYLGNKSGRGTITNNLILGNGTGISGFARAEYAVTNNAIVDNGYAGIDMRDSCRLSIRNNVLVKNQRGIMLHQEGTQNYNVVGKNAYWANATDVENLDKPAGSITADPQFADPDRGDFTVQGSVPEQGLANPQIIKELWTKYERLQRERPAEAASQPRAVPQSSPPAQAPAQPQTGSADAATVSQTPGPIQPRIDAAAPGATIRLEPGMYRERLVINKPLTLEGAGWDKTVIMIEKENFGSLEEANRLLMQRMAQARSDAEREQIAAQAKKEFLEKMSPLMLSVENAGDVVVRGIKFSSPGGHIKGTSVNLPIVKFDRSRVRMSDCAVIAGPGNGIHVQDGSDVEIDRTLVAAVWGTGLGVTSEAEPSRAHVHDCDIRNCRYAGIMIAGRSAEAVIERCRISGAAWHGIRYDDVSPILRNNLISGNARCGIYASGQTAATVRGNLLYDNEMTGMSCWFQNTDRIEGNTFARNERSGLEVLGASEPFVVKNIFYGNPTAVHLGDVSGSSPVAQSDGQITLEDNLFWANEHDLQWWRNADAKRTIPLDQRAGAVADPQFAAPSAGDFSLPADSPARRKGIGAAGLIPFESPWPLQREELAIIPEGDTRDSQQWRQPS